MNFLQPQIMGILNVTPDSFSDGGLYISDFARQNHVGLAPRISHLIEEGADIIDIGGESTGHGSKDVTLDEEMRRVKPVIDYVYENKLNEKAVFSIDTYKSGIAEYALSHSFEIVNDVTALRGDAGMIDVLLKYRPYAVLLYSKDNTPRTTSASVEYDDVIASVKEFLSERIGILTEAGFPKEKIIIDPGMGMFVSANPKYSFEIIERLGELKSMGYPTLVGVSRKSFLGGDLKNRDAASAEWSFRAIQNGADIVRVHDVGGLRNKIR